MNPIDAVAEAIREQAQDLARQAVAIMRREEPKVEGVVLLDERTDTLRDDHIWHATDPETGEECVLRLRVARGVIRGVEREKER